MSLIQSIKRFILKEDFDFTSPEINIFNFHPQLLVFLAAMGVFTNNKDSCLRFIWPIVCTSLTIIGIVFESIFVYHGISVKDYSFATRCFCYIVMLGVNILVYPSMLLNRDNILQLLQDMNADFLYICALGSNYRDNFLKGQLLIYRLCHAWLLFSLAVAFVYFWITMGPLLTMSLVPKQDVYATRPLPFPMWLPNDDPYRTPNYEIFLCLDFCFMFIFTQAFWVYVYIKFHVLLHYYTLMDIIIMDFDIIFDGLDETVAKLPRSDPRRMEIQRSLNKRMGRIVKWHLSTFKSVEIVSSVFGPPLAYQVMFSALAVCLMAYQIADKFEQGKLDIEFVMLLIGAVMQLWIPCYLGTQLKNKGYEVGDACWNCGWHETPLGRMLRTDIIIMIQRTQQPLTIKFIGLPQVLLETFSSSMTTAYSYFNMLRQYNVEE